MADKARRVRQMFAAIAHAYDLNNRLHSFGRDQAWRRRAVRLAAVRPTDVVLDVACGTADLTLAFARARPARVLGLDFTLEMLQLGQAKIQGQGTRGRGQAERAPQSPGPSPRPCFLAAADAMRLPLPEACVDIVSIAFGIRNVARPETALAEFYRVLKPGGRLIILEFSQPANPLIRWGSNLYCNHIMPHTAAWIARDRAGAYKYLPRSVSTFASRTALTTALAAAGFRHTSLTPVTFGIAVLYRAVK